MRLLALGVFPVRRSLLLAGFVCVLVVHERGPWLLASGPSVTSILTRCITCHRGVTSPSNLDLSSRQGALEGGFSGPALVPGVPPESLLLKKSSGGEMPPGDPLNSEEIETLRLWIEAGAAWPDLTPSATRPAASSDKPTWWSLTPLGPSKVPDLEDASWVQKPLDGFVLRGLYDRGLLPSGEADRRTLIRRATLDLTGLPPTPEEIEAFEANTSTGAYEMLLDRLLASPEYGERWGRHWLDLARFGESQGYERDKIRDNAWPYRDYVIDSFNQDKPYPQFVREQLAGDVIEPTTRASIAATGFLVAAPWDEVGHSQQSVIMRKRVRAEEMEDMVGTVAQTFLGLTVNCARCHDHKFDPISQRDYYRLKAALDGVWHGDRSLLNSAENEAHHRRVNTFQEKIRQLMSEVAALHESARERILKRRDDPPPVAITGLLSRWAFDADAYDPLGALHGLFHSSTVIAEGSLSFGKDETQFNTLPLQQDLGEKTLEAWLRIGDHSKGASFLALRRETPKPSGRTDILRYDGHTRSWLNASEHASRTTAFEKSRETEGVSAPVHIAITYDLQDRISIYRQGELHASYGPKREGPATKLQVFRSQTARVRFGPLQGARIEEARLYGRALTSEEIRRSFQSGIRNVDCSEVLGELSGEERKRRDLLLTELERQRKELEELPPIPQVYAANSRQPRPTYIQSRGDPAKPGDQVLPGGLSSIAALPADLGLEENAPEGERRLRLADWILDRRNPLTARVLVNRVWQHHFGRGIVGTSNDFGVNGEQPSHPELLDWLACWLMEHGWSLKALHKEIMLSSTYQQSSGFRKAPAEKDPDNRLLWRFSPRRLEAEVIRDALLASSGELNRERGGPGFRPFEVEIFNTHFYHLRDLDEVEMNRRSVYRLVVRSARDPLLEAFDCPDSAFKAPRRGITTTPLQALAMMNNSFVLRQSDRLSGRIEGEGTRVVASQVERVYRLTLGRAPRDDETKRALDHVHSYGLGSLCWALFNSSEFLYLN